MNKKKIKPFIKWAGGKTQILKEIEKNIPKELGNKEMIDTYIEPFVGGGSVFLHMVQKYNFKKIVINDINEELIFSYIAVKNNVNKLISKLNMLKEDFLNLNENKRKEFYYSIRGEYNNNEIDKLTKVCYFIFLNKTCFNGLYRVNKTGKFNVPFGKYKNPTIFEECNLKEISKLLQNVNILNCDFENTIDYVNDSTFIYLDPPYLPVSKSSFTTYTKYNFLEKDQIRLSNYYNLANKKNAKIMLSNSYNIEFFKKYYNNYTIKKITTKRMINCKGDKRNNNVYELLIINY